MPPVKTPSVPPRQQLRVDRPDSWIPVEEGDFLDGILEEVTAAYSDVQASGGAGDGYYPLLRIKVIEAPGYEADKVLALHAFSMVLRDRILEQQPIPGEHLIVTFEGIGEQKVKGRNAPALYRLRIEGRDPKLVAEMAYSGMRRRRGNPTAPSGNAPAPVVQTGDFVPPGDGTGTDDIPF